MRPLPTAINTSWPIQSSGPDIIASPIADVLAASYTRTRPCRPSSAVRASNHVVAHELEYALPELLSGNERARFGRRATENRLARLSEKDRKKVEEHRAFERERQAVKLSLDLQDANRKRGYLPGLPTRTTLTTSHPLGRPAQVDEVPNPVWRDPARQRPTNEPTGGTIMLNHPAEKQSTAKP